MYEDEFELTFDTPEEEPVYEPEKASAAPAPVPATTPAEIVPDAPPRVLEPRRAAPAEPAEPTPVSEPEPAEAPQPQSAAVPANGRTVLSAGGAVLLNHTLRTVYATAAVSVEPHGLGTAFSDGFVRRALTVYGLPGSVLETYCGTAIPFYPVNSGACGAETAWQYDLDTAALTISGSGPVADFAADVAPWSLFGAEIRQVTVEDGVTALPESSFANCTGLTRVTLGSGIEKMDANWFAHCPDLTELTVTATDTVFPAAVFAGVGDGLTLYGYLDTSVMDYARQHGLTIVPLGCHNRIDTDSGQAPTYTGSAPRSRPSARSGAS